MQDNIAGQIEVTLGVCLDVGSSTLVALFALHLLNIKGILERISMAQVMLFSMLE